MLLQLVTILSHSHPRIQFWSVVISVNYLPIRLKPFARFGFITILWHMKYHQLIIAYFFPVLFFLRIWSCPYKSHHQQRDPVWFTSDILPAIYVHCFFYQNVMLNAVLFSDFLFSWVGLAFAFFCCSFTTCYLAAVLLKQFIKQHWQEDEENFVPPVVSASEKVPAK